MEEHLFILLFFTGVVPLVQSVPRKYYLIQQDKTWSDAQAYCRAEHTDLAIIQSKDNMVQLQTEAQTNGFSAKAWIGLYVDRSIWRWSFRHDPLGNMSLWASGQPDNKDGNQWCAYIENGFWYDGKCTDGFPSVCFDDTKTGTNRYIIYSKNTWHEAQAYCSMHYTDLASVRDARENSVITRLTSGKTHWIGLYRDTWKWTNQTYFSTISWMTGQPYSDPKKNCGYLQKGQAANEYCTKAFPFFCYRALTGQQIMRVKVRSDEDVNDPALMAAILEQIKRKLKDHGMTENITVAWREQPDGKVFHKEKANNSTE